MTTPTLKLYPSAPIINIYLEQSLETKLNDVYSFNKSISDNKKNYYFLQRWKSRIEKDI